MVLDDTATGRDQQTERAGEQKSGEVRECARGSSVGRYILAGLIGHGGMGLVYKAFDPDLNRPVALKLLTVSGTGHEEEESSRQALNRSRLLREAQALAQLAHPNVVTIYDVGTFGEAVFIAMELVEGQTLKEWLKEQSAARRKFFR